MRDDEKMFNIGTIMLIGVVFLIVFLQVCYRVQNSNLQAVRRSMENIQHEYDIAKTRFSALSSADSLRGSVVGVNPRAETVSFSKTVHIDNIPMVGE
ncbi:MAG: hypothetical protein IK122_04035 [Alphaproteobacteria bacterium]|nr:hypothetical protein [Alphaproteobacteria bacterium]